MSFDVPYAITKRLRSVSMDSARSRVEAALKAEGFGVLTEIDVQATLKKKLGVESTPYVILGACNPQLAHQAISENPAIGLLLPCNVVLAADGEDLVVSAAAPTAMFGVAEAKGSASPLAKEAEERIRRAIEAI
jgi:uncharacterized protein (DUF302 family)